MTTKKIRTEAELRHYLTKRGVGRIVILEPIQLTNHVSIDRPVEIECAGAGAIINGFFMFHVASYGVHFRLCKFESIKDMLGLQLAIKFDSGFGHCSVYASSFVGFSWAAIWQFNCQSLTVERCYIKGSGGSSYNYGIWLGGKTNGVEQNLFLLNCPLIEDVRHAIGSSYHPNSYYAIGNTISTLKHSFDRHNWNDGGRKGGLHTHIIGNIFEDSDRLAFSIEPPYEGGSFSFIGNTLNHSKERWIGEVSDQRVWEGKIPDWYNAQGNKFNS